MYMVQMSEPTETAHGNPKTPPSGEALAVGFEPRDINARGAAMVLATIAVVTAVVIGIVFIMVWRFDIARRQSSLALTPQQTEQSVPPEPHLQVDPFVDLLRQRDRENRLLNSYGWTNADHSLARIPLARAMALSVGKSLDASP
jgi:uncharacterized protein HemX